MSVYSSLKAFHFPGKVKDFLEEKHSAPIHIRLKPTNACNHDCWFCAYKSSNLSLGEDMNSRDSIPLEKMKELINDFSEMKIHSVTLSGGGEPLAYRYINETIIGLGERGIKIGVITNGTFLKNDIAKNLSKYASWVRISTDAWDGESLKKSRSCSEKEFDNILEQMKSFSRIAKQTELGVSFIVTKENHEKIFAAAVKFKNAGAKHIKISPCVTSVDGKENNLYHTSFKEKVFALIKECESLEDENFSIINHYHEMESDFTKEYKTCPYLQFLTVIGADCKVYTCQDKAYMDDGLLGDIAEQSFKAMWNSTETIAAIKDLNPKKTCNHHCVTDPKNKILNDLKRLKPGHEGFV